LNKKFVVVFNPKPAEWRAAKEIFVAAGHPQFAREPQREFGYTLRFSNEDEYERFVADVEAHGIPLDKLFTRIERRIFPGEIASRGLESPLVWLQVSSAPSGEGGPRYGTDFDLGTGCSLCGTGARQVSPLYVRLSDAPKTKAWATLDGEILLRTPFAAALEGCTGLELRQALSSESGESIEWWQVIPLDELPPMANTTVGIRQDPRMMCPLCRLDGYGTGVDSTIRYELDPDQQSDVSRTYEYFGRSGL
jgi:hypothetical protein